MKYYLVALMLSVCLKVHGQVDKHTYEQAVNYLNCKTIEQTLVDRNVQLEEFKSKCDCGQFTQLSFDKIKAAIPLNYSATRDLAIEIESLKENYLKAKDNPVEYLTIDIFEENKEFKKLSKFKSNRKGEVFEDFQLVINDGISQILGNKDQLTTAEEDSKNTPNLIGDTTVNPESSPVEKTEAGWFTIELDVISLIFTVIAFLIYISYLKFNKDSDEVSNEIKNYVKKKLALQSNNGGISLSHLASLSEVNILKSEIEKLKQQVSDLKSKHVNDLSTASNQIQVGDIIPLTKVEEKPKNFEKLTFYLSSPNVDESFNSTSISNVFKNGASIYKFTKLNEQYADFEIDNREDAMKLALGFPDKNIDPACEAQNAFNPRAKSVYTSKPGRAELLGDKWKIRSKAVIQYI